jgi:hypothetical protein
MNTMHAMPHILLASLLALLSFTARGAPPSVASRFWVFWRLPSRSSENR